LRNAENITPAEIPLRRGFVFSSSCERVAAEEAVQLLHFAGGIVRLVERFEPRRGEPPGCRFAAPAAMQLPLRVCRSALPRGAFAREKHAHVPLGIDPGERVADSYEARPSGSAVG